MNICVKCNKHNPSRYIKFMGKKIKFCSNGCKKKWLKAHTIGKVSYENSKRYVATRSSVMLIPTNSIDIESPNSIAKILLNTRLAHLTYNSGSFNRWFSINIKDRKIIDMQNKDVNYIINHDELVNEVLNIIANPSI